MKRFFKISLLCALAVALAAGAGLLALGAGWFNTYLKNYVESALGQALATPVHIGNLQGNPLGSLTLSDIRAGDEAERLLQMEGLDLHYRLLPLVMGEVVVDTVRLRSPLVALRQDAAGAWNLPAQAAEPDTVSAPATPSAGRAYRIRVGHAEVVDGEVRLRTSEAESQVRDLNLALGFSANADGYAIELRRFRTLIFEPPLIISNLSGLAVLRNGSLTVDGLTLTTPGSSMRIDGTVADLSEPAFDLTLQADSLAFQEVARVVPGDYPDGKLVLGGAVKGGMGDLKIEMKAALGAASCALKGRFNLVDPKVAYEIDLDARGVDLAQMAPQWDADAAFDLSARIRGQGTTEREAAAEAALTITRARLFGVRAHRVELTAKVKGGRIRAALRATGDAGTVAADGEADLARSMPLYDLRVRLAHLDLSRLPQGPSEKTNVTGALRLRQADDETWAGTALLDTLEAGGQMATALTLRGRFREGAVELDSLGFRLPYAAVQGSGRADLGRLWSPSRGMPAYQAAVRVIGLDLEALTGDARLKGLMDLQLSLDGTGVDPDSIQAVVTVEAEAPAFLGVGLDSARAKVTMAGRTIDLERFVLACALARLEGSGQTVLEDRVTARIEGEIHRPGDLGKVLGAEISGGPVAFSASAEGRWAEPLFCVALSADSLAYEDMGVTELALRADSVSLSDDTTGTFTLQAGSARWGEQTLRNARLDAVLAGREVSFSLQNSPEDPYGVFLSGRVGDLDAGASVALDSLALRVGQDVLANMGECRARYTPAAELRVERLHLAGPMGQIRANGRTDTPGTVDIQLVDIDLRRWAGLLGLTTEVAGMLNMNIVASGLPDLPEVSAEVNLKDASVAGFGFQGLAGTLAYRGMQASANLRILQTAGKEIAFRGETPLALTAGASDPPPDGPFRIEIKSDGIDLAFLQVFSEDIREAAGTLALDVSVAGTPQRPEVSGWVKVRNGGLKAIPLNQTFSRIQADLSMSPDRIVVEQFVVGEKSGSLSLSGDVILDRQTVQTFRADLRAADFRVINLPDINATLRANLHLEGDANAVRLTGNIELIRAVIYIAGFLEGPSDTDLTASPFYSNLNTNVRISARRNVWIRDPNLNLEISGDLDVRKDRQGLRVYGSLNSRQGRYEFQGTRFNLERGEVQFQGKTDLDPDIYILGTHPMRLAGGDRGAISVIVGGTLKYPQVTLESDPPMPMSEILSYLLLGGPSEREGPGPGLEARAAGVAVGVAANQLKRTIGRRLNLDLIEIDTGGSGVQRVRVGKYIGQKLFVTYTQEAGGGGEMTVEYELTPQLTVEAQQRTEGELRRQRQSIGMFWKTEW